MAENFSLFNVQSQRLFITLACTHSKRGEKFRAQSVPVHSIFMGFTKWFSFGIIFAFGPLLPWCWWPFDFVEWTTLKWLNCVFQFTQKKRKIIRLWEKKIYFMCFLPNAAFHSISSNTLNCLYVLPSLFPPIFNVVCYNFAADVGDFCFHFIPYWKMTMEWVKKETCVYIA